MTRIQLIAALIFALVGTIVFPSEAQSVSKEKENPEKITGRIEIESGGNITIDIPDNLLNQLTEEEKITHRNSGPVLKHGINKLQGYRIQIFSDGHNQHSLEARAKARGNAVIAKFPKYRGQVYSFSSSPNWYTRIGNFRTQEQANAAMAELKRAFPQFASEMRVVKSSIVVIK
ncbi:MAG: SPOR domain-containing protein [Muribaculaceae bacterium]|nr:SPOR domain-containing protein [Muribaculaceae bacterium]